MLKKTTFVLLLSWIFAISCSAPHHSRQTAIPEKPADTDERLTKIKMTDMDGRPVSLKDFAGKPVFLNFWATWCGPCTSEMKSIEKAYQQFKNDIVFLAASNETPSLIQSFAKKQKLNFNFVHLEVTYLDVYIVALPTTMLIDAKGQLVSEEEGFRDWSDPGSIDKLKSLLK